LQKNKCMSRKLFLLLFLVFVASVGFAQNINTVVRKIAKHNIYEGPVVGFAVSSSKQYERFEILQAKASKEKLIAIASKHKNAVVRLYAYNALLYKEQNIPTELKEKFAADKTSIKTLSGCIGGQRKVCDIVSNKF
jgi:hypothetical protein